MALMRQSRARGTAADDTPQRSRARVRTARALSSLVLATVLALMVVLADHLVSLWSSGRLVVAIAVLWLVLFAGLVLLSGVVRRWSDAVVGIRCNTSARIAQGVREQQMADGARRDPRARAELRAAEAQDEQMPLSPVHDAPDTHF
jgi:hypothetical protein